MTSQTVLNKSPRTRQSVSEEPTPTLESRLSQSVKRLYNSDHQAEYLDINAQIELLLHQVQAETQKLATTSGQ